VYNVILSPSQFESGMPSVEASATPRTTPNPGPSNRSYASSSNSAKSKSYNLSANGIGLAKSQLDITPQDASSSVRVYRV
jgi:hypothetical protein